MAVYELVTESLPDAESAGSLSWISNLQNTRNKFLLFIYKPLNLL